jgi:hypothetical protein
MGALLNIEADYQINPNAGTLQSISMSSQILRFRFVAEKSIRSVRSGLL